MSTRSQIAKLESDGKVKSIYCHFDGYLSNNGELLLNYYNTEEKVNELIALGSLSTLDEHVAPLPEAPPSRKLEVKNGDLVERSKHIVLKGHTYEEPQEGVTVAYHRDRGEDLRISEYSSLDEFLKEDHCVDYLYVWKDGKWFFL